MARFTGGAAAQVEVGPRPNGLALDPGRGHNLWMTDGFHAALREFLRRHAPL